MIVHHSPIILASKSPRRKELLEDAGIHFSIEPSRVRESDFPSLTPERYAETLARAKAADIADRHPDTWVIGADSIVYIDETILEKPESVSDAREMIRRLSGRSHFVFTGYCLICRKRAAIFAETVRTEVIFKSLSDAEIEWYIHTEEPYDKAGGYAIQGLGSFMVKSIIGSYTNVVGLPLCEVLDHLTRMGVIDRRAAVESLRTAALEGRP
jgi:septum formation protein